MPPTEVFHPQWWAQFGLAGVMLCAMMVVVYMLGRFAIRTWSETVEARLDAQNREISRLVDAVAANAESQRSHFRVYHGQMRRLVRAVAELAAQLGGRKVDLSFIEVEEDP